MRIWLEFRLRCVSRAPINSPSATMWHGSLCLRDYPELSKLRELPSETLMRIDAISEACLADLDCAQDCFLAEVKHPVHKGPVRNLLVWRCMQSITSHYRIPQRALLTHLRNSGHRQRLGDGKIIESSQFVPKLPPAIDVPIRHIEDLVARLILAERPQGGTPKQFCI